ncbi:WD repeat- and FYVE domain-containing protein 4 isoform X3 [Gouania willdenowi]|uniref:WD repeat- and FYVE domain-containing protein 4 isoform X3 n=1 Tax=Gouania willdenowi TaxID=441366 RepID=UPI0010551B4E|nr:WD repeat- and FYVE domain-containing protein 4 isoform X3 [Gouania willdenowi]
MALTNTQIVKEETIDKETQELSASEDLFVSEESNMDEANSCYKSAHILKVLREQLQDLGTYTSSSSDCRDDQVSLEQSEQRLNKVLPLYIQVCEDGCSLEGLNIKKLAALTADSLIQNINGLLTERPADEAREEIVQFFKKPQEKEHCEREESLGGLLLKSLSLFTADSSDILSCINPSLPAALVKCLYLLVCLPAKKENISIEETFQELLTRVLLQLCRSTANVDSLVETQELQCLIIGLTSLWDQTSSSWRHQASRVVKAVSAVASDNTVPSLQGKNCMRICIQNLLHISSDVTGPMLAEVAVAVFSFIRDSYQVNPALFVEFDNNDGYKALENILKRCEEGVALDQFQPVEELLALIASFTLLGKAELKVAVCVTNPQPPGFKFDPLLTKGVTVKNLSAFQLLQACLLRSGDSLLCCQLLQTLHGIWERDPINFFLLEWTAQPLTQLAACLWRKPRPVQKLFFSLFEMVVFKLNYIPHETLRGLLGVLKQIWDGTIAWGSTGVDYGVEVLKCFTRMTLQSGIVAEVLSDSGLLKMLFGELRKRAKILRKAGVASSAKTDSEKMSCLEERDELLTTYMLELVSGLTRRSIKNIVSLRDLGMVPYIKIFLDVDQFRGPTLRILEQLAEINPEEFMSTAIGALCSSTQQELRLKQDLLQSILKVLESPNNWDAFRKAGGFTGLLSLIIDMEGALSDPPREETWKSLGYQPLVNLLLLTLHILALANHLHSVNAHYFEVGGFYERLAEALLQLGCFQPVETEKWSAEEMWPCSNLTGNKQCPGLSFHQLVELAEQPETPTSPSIQLQFHLPIALKTCIRLLSFFDQFAFGTYSPQEFILQLESKDRKENTKETLNETEEVITMGSVSSLVHIGSGSPPIEDKEGSSPSSLTSCTMSQDRFTCTQTILHSGAVRVFMTLLPSVFTPEDSQLSMEVQFSLAHHLQVMIKSERNRQIMCEGGLVSTILTNCQDVLLTPNHPLHLPITCILEKLSSQSITRADFRKFLCLGNPLMCLAEKTTEQRKRQSDPSSLKDESTDGDDRSSRKAHTQKCTLLQSPAIPVHQIIGLVSMTSPRNFKPHRLSSSPAFVEFDMSESGYGCLFLPTLATVQGVAADSISTGGIGGNCRSFPPTAGLSFSCWFQIDKFSSACDSHPIRLFSVVRHMSRTEQQYVCLSITFSSYDGCLVVSTDETAFTYLDMMEPEVSTPTSLPTSLRFHCSSMLVPGQWHHVVVVMTKDVKKSCLTSAYFNGKVVSTGKMKYIQPFPGQYVSMDPTAVIDVFGVIGTPALWKERVSLVWRVGPSYLFEEPLSPEAVCVIYIQGTAYLGNFLALRNTSLEPDAESVPLRLVPEERISFGINPSISSMTTVAQIREKYNEVDCRLIAKEMGIPSRDNSAPVFLAKNVSQHLNGTARTIGAALIGQFGVRTFTPHMASNGFLYVGGPAVVLSLVAMATDDGSLYAAVKVLLSVLETNTVMQQEMNRISGYKLLAILLKSKSSLISPRTLQLVLHLSCSLELGCSSCSIQNLPAFQALIGNMEMWKNTVGNLDLSVLKHLAEILKCDDSDAATMRSLDLMPKLLFELCDPAVTVQKVNMICCVITSLLHAHFSLLDVCRIGLFLLYTLPPSTNTTESTEMCGGSHDSTAHSGPASFIWIRNQLLLVICEILDLDNHLINDSQQEAALDSLGSDWFLHFLQPHLHPSTLKMGLILLTHFLSSPTRQICFKDQLLSGTLINGIEEASSPIDNLRPHVSSFECFSITCPGFDVLRELLIGLAHLPQLYEALATLLLGKKASHTSESQPLDDVLQSLIKSQRDDPDLYLSVEVATTLLKAIKFNIRQQNSSSDGSQELQISASVMQFFSLLHNLCPRNPLWRSASFLHALADVVYPELKSVSESSSEKTNSCETLLTAKPVFDFIRILLMDSLLNMTANPDSHPLVLLLQFSPDSASLEQKRHFQKRMLELIMNIIQMLSVDNENHTHLISKDCNNQRSDGQMGKLMENVVLFSKTLLQTLYSGIVFGDPDSLLHFLADQIVASLEKGQTQKEMILSELFTSTNKVLLFFLSQPRRTREEKDVVIRTLRTFMDCWDIVMATYNSNMNFIICLLHCLLQISSGSYREGFSCVDQKVHQTTTASCESTSSIELSENLCDEIDTTADEVELKSLAKECWTRVLSERQRMLEENSKMEISASHSSDIKPVCMTELSPLWEEMAHKTWLLYTVAQRKKATSGSQKIFDILCSTSGKHGKDSEKVKEFLSGMDSRQRRGHDIFENMKRNHIQLHDSEWELASSHWLRLEAELLRERAVFGPGPGVLLSRDWFQDAAEGRNRTKSRIRRKAHRQSVQVLGLLGLGSRPASLEESRNGAESEKECKILCDVGAEMRENKEDGGEHSDQLTFFPVLNETPAIPEGPLDPPTPQPCTNRQDCPDIRIIVKELHPEEEVKAKMCVVMVSGLRVTEALLLFGKESLFLCEGFTLSPNEDVCCRKHHPSRVRDSFISSMLTKELPSRCRRWLYEDIKAARLMRFLLEDNAIELFVKSGHSAFLVFLNKDHVSAYKRLSTVVPALKGRGVTDIIANAKRTPVVEKTALVKWQMGEISNFEYLMHLNTIAGRTYNDLMQYPVFPWVLADYQSEVLDLSNPSSFRDLSKPMGAQTEKRKQMFIQRYEEMKDCDDEDLSAQCHYCTHYSSAIIVASFLVRMMPFSHTFQALQGGLDIAERLFYSVAKEWESASRDYMGDVRELIPEFFYLPDFLQNSNNINLGCREDGTVLGDVELPPWAKGDPQEFIRVHREALESDHVSSTIHLWIDLIFGFRQQGPAAVECVNTFHPYFFAQHGRRDTRDPVVKNTIRGYINNFGQVPKQLFTKPHPPRYSSTRSGSLPSQPVPFFFDLDKMRTTQHPFRELHGGPVGEIVCLEKEVVVLERNRLLLSPQLGWFFSWGFPDNSCGFGNLSTEKTFAISENLCDWGETLCAACPNPSTIITAGTNTVVCVWDVLITKDKIPHIRLKQPLYGHTDAVTCLAVSEVHGIIVSGSSDLTCILWDMEDLSYITQLAGHETSISALAINDLTGEVVSCAGPLMYLWTSKGQLLAHTDTSCGPQSDILCVRFTQRHEWDARNVIVSGCADGVIRIWRTEYTRTQLPGPPEEPVSPGQERTERDVGISCRVQHWERHLVLCRELSRSQTVPQRRYKNNPAITALGMSRSHATLCAGDAWGSVFTWTCE